MAKLRSISLLALLITAWGIAGADTLTMEGTAAVADEARPTRGMTQASVETRYGSPQAIKAAVGDPPITRWEYKDFVVYFEHDRVIHSVRRR